MAFAPTTKYVISGDILSLRSDKRFASVCSVVTLQEIDSVIQPSDLLRLGLYLDVHEVFRM